LNEKIIANTSRFFPVSLEAIHPLIDVVIGLGLVCGGLLALAVAHDQISLSARGVRRLLFVFGLGFLVGGIDQLAVALTGMVQGDPFSLVEYLAVMLVVGVPLFALPWFVIRTVSAQKTIVSLRGEIRDTGRLADEVRAQQEELSARYEANSNALAKTAVEAFRFEALVRSSRDAVIGVNPDGTIWHWNPAAEELCKRRARDMLGRSLEVVRVGTTGDLWKEAQRVVHIPYLKAQGEVSLVAGDGSIVPVWFSVSHLPEQSGGGFSIIARNMSDKKAVEDRISSALMEKEALLKEVHHRVKNNLQLICSLLRLQSKEAVDEAGLRLFRKSEERIRSLALVHERLYRSESLSTINFGGYLHDLASQLIRSSSSPQRPVEADYAIAELQFPIDAAITCGLIVNELVTNSIKHAKSDGGPMKLRVGLERRPEEVLISVWDNGTTPVPDNLVDQSASLGLSLVRTLTRQLGGHVQVSQGRGVTFTVHLPIIMLTPKESTTHRVAA
jgi:PAS domain S-box-containing protein